MALSLLSPRNLLLILCPSSQSIATLLFQQLRPKPTGLSWTSPPNTSVSPVDSSFQIHLEFDCILPPLLLPLWPQPPRPSIWIIFSSLWPGLPALTPSLHSPFEQVMSPFHHLRKSQRHEHGSHWALWHYLHQLKLILLQPYCYSFNTSSISPRAFSHTVHSVCNAHPSQNHVISSLTFLVLFSSVISPKEAKSPPCVKWLLPSTTSHSLTLLTFIFLYSAYHPGHTNIHLPIICLLHYLANSRHSFFLSNWWW